MEILLELVFWLAGLLLEMFGEVLLQLGVELGARSLAAPFKREGSVHPAFTAVGYSLFGAAAGGLSLLVFPDLFVRSPTARLASLVATPVIAGLLMAVIGRRRAAKGQPTIAIDRFACGYLFALAMAGTRYAFGH